VRPLGSAGSFNGAAPRAGTRGAWSWHRAATDAAPTMAGYAAPCAHRPPTGGLPATRGRCPLPWVVLMSPAPSQRRPISWVQTIGRRSA